MRLTRDAVSSDKRRRLLDIGGEEVAACYQCGKCSAGCAMGSMMDVLPHQVIRLVQLGQAEEALACRTIWLCASCLACSARCPRGVSLPHVMEALRATFLRSGGRRLDVTRLPLEAFDNAPEQAFVAGMRKYT